MMNQCVLGVSQTIYWLGVCRGQVDPRPNIHWCMHGSGGLPTEYWLGVCRGQADPRPNIDWCMRGSGGLLTEYLLGICRGQADYRLNIYRVYAWVWRIPDQILIRCMQGSGGLLTEYSLGVCRGQADYRLNIQLVYARVRRIADQMFIGCMQGVRRITDWIFIRCMQESGGLLTEYSLGVCRGQADYRLNIHSVYARDQVDCLPNIYWAYAGVRRITDWIFIRCMQGSGGLLTEYSLGICRGQADCGPNID